MLKVQAQGAQVGARLQLEQGRLPSEERGILRQHWGRSMACPVRRSLGHNRKPTCSAPSTPLPFEVDPPCSNRFPASSIGQMRSGDHAHQATVLDPAVDVGTGPIARHCSFAVPNGYHRRSSVRSLRYPKSLTVEPRGFTGDYMEEAAR